MFDLLLTPAGRDKTVLGISTCTLQTAVIVVSKEMFFKAERSGLFILLRCADVAFCNYRGNLVIPFAILRGLAYRLSLCGNNAVVHAAVILRNWTASVANQQHTFTQRLTTGDEHA